MRVYLFAILISIALSAWLNANVLINPDGILYIQTAQAFLDGGLSAALSTYQWPFYSILIALVHQLTHFSLEFSAILLNAFLNILVVTSFIRLTKSLGGNYQVQVCAAIIILLHTGLNEYRSFIIRDIGHWAFMLYALYFLITYAHTRHLRYALAFSCASAIAFLFRTEAIFIMLFAPMVLLLPIIPQSLSRRFTLTFGAYILFIPFMVLAAFNYELFTANHWLNISSKLTQFSVLFEQKLQELTLLLPIHIKSGHVLFFILGGMLSYFFAYFLITLSLPYSLLAAYSIYKKGMPASSARAILITFIIIYLVIVFGFLYHQLFLTGRYIMPIVLLFSLWVPFGLSTIYDDWKTRKSWLLPLALASFLYLLGDGLVSTGASQLYIKEAGVWLADHTSENTSTYTNNIKIEYYSQNATYNKQADLSQILNNNAWKKYDYLAIVIKQKDTQLQEKMHKLPLTPIQVFQNKRGDKVEIFKTHE